jgi:hypothetical protein
MVHLGASVIAAPLAHPQAGKSGVSASDLEKENVSIARLRLSVFCGITILLLLVKTPNVFAQTTTITGVSYTRTALFDIDTQTPTPALIVNATIGYGDAKAGDYLLVGVFDLDDGNPVSGLGSSSPLSCSSTVGVAGCLVPLSKKQGVERMSFSLDHPKGVWNLALIAALLDNASDPIANSYSDYTFTMTVQTALTFKVNVPVEVPVSVDGVNGSGGSVQLVLVAGNHTISVPQFVSVNNVTRLKFLNWSDGSTALNRTVELDHDITLNGNYVTQYYLHVISPVSVNGTGWYDAGATVTLSIQSNTYSMGGIIGILGGKWVFQNWSQGRSDLSSSSAVTLAMNSPQSVNAQWAPDYTVPFAILGFVSVLSAGTFYFTKIRATRKSRRPSGLRRSRSKPRVRPRKRKITR